MIRTERDRMHDKLETILNERDRNNPGFSVAWRATRIGGSEYAHSADVWQRLEAGEEPPRYAIDDEMEDVFEEPEYEKRRDRKSSRSQEGNRSYGRGLGAGRLAAMDSVSVAMDSLEDLPLEKISEATDAKLGQVADTLRETLTGKTLNTVQRSYLTRLKSYLSGKKSIQQCSVLTLTTLLRGLATQ
ncbi:MAG: hypothetical protein WA581_13705 [Candidatus Acidiferrales bacterium]